MPSLLRPSLRHRTGYRTALALLTALPVGTGALPGQNLPPEVHVIATGGTIASGGAGRPLTVEELVGGFPPLAGVARITVEQFTNIGSSQVTPDHWISLSRRIGALLAERPGLSGVVVTHGTDTLEETALFLHLTVGDPRPVVLTGAMRPPSVPGPEGTANLLAAVRTAVHPGSRGRGALVVMNDQIFSAGDVTKAHTSRLDAFRAPVSGPVGEVDGDLILFRTPPSPPPARFDPEAWGGLPRVEVLHAFAGADGTLAEAALAAGAQGIVIASVGRGNMPAPLREAALRAAEGGVAVVVSNRTGAGRVPVGPEPALAADPGPLPGTSHLNPQRARVVLMLSLARGDSREELIHLLEAF